MHVREMDLELYALGRLPMSEVSAIESHLAQCEACEDKLAEVEESMIRGAAPGQAERVAEERRNAVRIPTNDRAFLMLLNPVSSRHLNVVIVNASRGGIKLRVPEVVQAGTIVQVRFRDTLVMGEVRYCVPAGGEFHVGVHLQDVFKFSGGRA